MSRSAEFFTHQKTFTTNACETQTQAFKMVVLAFQEAVALWGMVRNLFHQIKTRFHHCLHTWGKRQALKFRMGSQQTYSKQYASERNAEY